MNELYYTESVDSIPIRIGRTQYGRDVVVDLARDAAHWIYQGKTRSGKSQASYNLLAQCATNPAVRVVGSDPTTVLLRPFVEREHGEHYIHLGTDYQQRTVDVLRWVKAESDRRIEGMWDRRIDKYTRFSAAFPLILVVAEEFPGIIEAATDEDAAEARKPADRIAPRLQSLIRQLAAQSAKAGIRLLLLAQRAEANIVGGNARSNFAVKMSLRLDEPESLKMLHPTATLQESALAAVFPPGVGFFEQPVERREIIRTDLVGDYAVYAQAVLTSDRGYLGNLNVDRAQREYIAESYPEIGDPG